MLQPPLKVIFLHLQDIQVVIGLPAQTEPYISTTHIVIHKDVNTIIYKHQNNESAASHMPRHCSKYATNNQNDTSTKIQVVIRQVGQASLDIKGKLQLAKAILTGSDGGAQQQHMPTQCFIHSESECRVSQQSA